MSTTEIRASRDLGKLALLAGKLQGEKCLRAELSYGDELVLHFGEPRPYRHPKLQGQVRGSWVLETFATPWMLLQVPGRPNLLFGVLPTGSVPVPRDDVEASLVTLQGASVSEVRVTDCDVNLRFDTGAIWTTLARYAEPDLDLPLWELLTPDRMYLKVWGQPAPMWSWLPSDRPDSTAGTTPPPVPDGPAGPPP
jgi:hypothetical protein